MSKVTGVEKNSGLLIKFCWVIALRAEATPLIDVFNMKIVENKSLFPIYANEVAGHALVISGMGSIKAAAAATFLKNHLKINSYSGCCVNSPAGHDKSKKMHREIRCRKISVR